MRDAISHPIVDLRSDTVTRPTPAMRRAMAEAEVGDDVYAEDPTVNRLQSRAAEIFGREAALFFPSGSMANLVAIKCWTQPGMEVICDQRAHICNYELGAMSAIAGCMPRTTPAPDGILTWDMIQPLIRPKIYYYAQTGLIELENTHNMHGGTIYPQPVTDAICDRARDAGIPVHLDGARIFNAAVALGRSVAEIARKCDSVMFSLSKGLGAPVGSMLAGSRDFIERAHVYRKLMGGGMRQIGILAAAGIIALEEGPKNLPRDHENARRLADGLARIPGITLDPKRVVTNIVFCDVDATGRTADEICAELAKRGILAGAMGKFTVRLVTHCDVDRAGMDRAIAAFAEVVAPRGSASART
jgi:threonine aldolase